MANVNANIAKLTAPNKVAADCTAPDSFAANDKVYVPMNGRTTLIAITATTAGNIVISKGDGVAAVSDLTLALKDKVVSYIQLDSSSYEILSGDNKGKCLITPAVAGTISVVNAL